MIPGVRRSLIPIRVLYNTVVGQKLYVQCSYFLLFFIDTSLLPNSITCKKGDLLAQAHCWGTSWSIRPTFHVEYSTVSGGKGKHLASTFWCARSTPTTIQIACDTNNIDSLVLLFLSEFTTPRSRHKISPQSHEKHLHGGEGIHRPDCLPEIASYLPQAPRLAD